MNLHDIDRMSLEALATVEDQGVFTDATLVAPDGTVTRPIYAVVNDQVTEFEQVVDGGAVLELLRAEVGQPVRYSAVHAGRWFVINARQPSQDESLVLVTCQQASFTDLTDEQQQAWEAL